MKKKFLLLPVFAAFVFSLASCDKKEANVKYVDAEGNEQTVVVKATDDSEQTSKALYAIAQAAQSEQAKEKHYDMTKFGVEVVETIDAKLGADDYLKTNIKLEAAVDQGVISATVEGDLDVNYTALRALAGVAGGKAKVKANAYYDSTKMTDTYSPNLYFDYDLSYKLEGLDAEQKLDGKYYITQATVKNAFTNLLQYAEGYMKEESKSIADVEDMYEQFADYNPFAGVTLETEADFKSIVEAYGIKISAVSSSEIEFACDFKYDNFIPYITKLIQENPAVSELKQVKEALEGVTIPLKLAINTEFLLPSRVEVDYGKAFTQILKTTSSTGTVNLYANAEIDAKFSLKILYNGGTVKTLTDTADYKEFTETQIPFIKG